MLPRRRRRLCGGGSCNKRQNNRSWAEANCRAAVAICKCVKEGRAARGWVLCEDLAGLEQVGAAR